MPAAFTLLEMVLSITILAIIMLGAQSAMMLAAKAAPDRADGTVAASRAAGALDQFAADLSYATSIVTSTATSIEFTVPDRNGDNHSETIAYSWAGSGHGLIRSVNGAAGVTICPNVTQFQLAYDKRSTPQTQTYTQSGEMLLSGYDLGLLNLGDFRVQNGNFCGQIVNPSLPGSAVRWRVTRVKLKARQHGGSSGLARVQVRNVSGAAPGVVTDEAIMAESTLGSTYSWQEFTFTNDVTRTPGSSVAIVVQWQADGDACDVQYQSLLGLAADSYFLTTSNGGASWNTPAAQDMAYYLYGTYFTADAVGTDYWLKSVRCSLQSGSDATTRLYTTVRVLNEPQVSGP